MATKKRQPSLPPSGPAIVYALSDSTSNLLRHMLAAYLTQFPDGAIEVRYESFVRGEKELEQAFSQISNAPGAVFHAVVAPKLKQSINRRCKKLGVAAWDATGSAVDFLAKVAGVAAHIDPNRLHRIDDSYQRRIDAMEFTMNHDDGLGAATLHEADVVLAGVSRTGKTPTSIVLAQQHGLKVANVALAMEVQPPRELLELPKRQVVGLLIDTGRLAEIRTRRQDAWKMGTTSYNEHSHVEDEIAWSRRLFNRTGWHALDITDQAIEETAGRILQWVHPK